MLKYLSLFCAILPVSQVWVFKSQIGIAEAATNVDETDEQVYCYNGCSGHGECVRFTCVCDPGWHGESCNTQFAELPVLSVGNGTLTLKNFRKKCKKRDVVLIGISSSSCAKCAFVESEYSLAMESLSRLKVPFYRIDASKDSELVDELGVKDLPKVVSVWKKGRKKRIFKGIQKKEAIVGYALKLKSSSSHLIQEAHDLDKFFADSVFPSFDKTVVLAIGIFEKPGKHEDEFEDFKEGCEDIKPTEQIFCLHVFAPISKEILQLSNFNSFPVVITVRFEKSATWWSQKETGSLLEKIFAVYEEEKRNSRYMTIASHSLLEAFPGDLSLQDWVQTKSVALVDELTPTNFPLYERLRLPMLILFLNPDRKRDTLLKNAFKRSAQDFYGRISFVTADSRKYEEKMFSLGLFDGKHQPAMTVSVPSGKIFVPFSGDLKSHEQISKYCAAVLSQSLKVLSHADLNKRASLYKPKQVPADVKGISESFDESKDGIEVLTQDNLTSIAFDDETRDVVILFHRQDNEACRSLAPYYKKVARRFRELKIESLSIARYDLTVAVVPDRFKHIDFEVPALVILPAFSKSPPFRFFSDVFKVATVMNWIQTHAGAKFELPELAHFTDNEQKLFKEQIKARELRRLEREKEL